MLSSVEQYNLEIRRACLKFKLIMPSGATDSEWALLHMVFAEPGTDLVRGMRHFFLNERKVESPYYSRPMSRLDVRLCRSLIEDIRQLPYVWTACQDFHLDLQRKGAERYLTKQPPYEKPDPIHDSILRLYRSASDLCDSDLPPHPSLACMVEDIIRARRNIFSVTKSNVFDFHRLLKQHPSTKAARLQLIFFELAEALVVVPLTLLLEIQYSTLNSSVDFEPLEPLRRWYPKMNFSLVKALQLFSELMLRGSYLRTSPLVALSDLTSGIDTFDLIQEALLGAIIGADRFDYRTDSRALEPGTTWAWQRVQRFAANHAQTVRLPIQFQVQKNRDLQKSQDRPCQTRLTTALPLNSVLRLTGTIEDEEKYKPFGERCEETSLEFHDIPFVLPTPHIELNNVEILENLFDALSERERNVIELRFGLSERLPQTLDAIGGVLGVTRERIRQIEKKALDKLARRAKLNIDTNDYWSQCPQYFPVNPNGLAQTIVSLARTHLYSQNGEMQEIVGRKRLLLKRAFRSLPTWRGNGGRRGSASRLERLMHVMRSFDAPAHHAKIHAALCLEFPYYERTGANTCACLYKQKDLFECHGNGYFSLVAIDSART